MAWGLNTYGQLGDGSTTNRRTPVVVSGITNAVAIAAGADHSVAVLADGSVRTWGRGYRGALGSGAKANRLVPGAVSGLPANVVLVEAGRDHTMAITATGQLWDWGFNTNGQLGAGGITNKLSAQQVPGISRRRRRRRRLRLHRPAQVPLTSTSPDVHKPGQEQRRSNGVGAGVIDCRVTARSAPSDRAMTRALDGSGTGVVSGRRCPRRSRRRSS